MMIMMKSESGQLTIEMMLLMTVLLAFFMAISNYFKSSNPFATVISGPWQYVSGMIQTGSWQDATKLVYEHPNNRDRHRTLNAPPAVSMPGAAQPITNK